MNVSTMLEVGSSLCVQVGLIVAVCVGLQRWVVDARWACRLWTICLLSIMACVASGVLLPHRRMYVLQEFGSRETMFAVLNLQERIAWILLSIWGIGVTISVLKKGVLCWQLTRFLKSRCEEVDRDRLNEVLSIQGDFHANNWLPKNLQVLSSDEIQGPFCWQLHRPIVVLPTSLLNDDSVLMHVLFHEIEHLRTHHPMQHFLQGSCSTVFWFHPALRFVARGTELTREYLCDEVAAVSCGKFSDYLRTLAKVAEQCGSVSCTSAPRGTLAFGNQKSALILRCDRLVGLAQHPRAVSTYRHWFATAVLIVAVLLIHQIWLPTNLMASRRSAWSPWPTWTAKVLHNTVGIEVRDFESFQEHVHRHEWIHDD